MRTIRLYALAVIGVSLLASSAPADEHDPWLGTAIMPASDAVRLTVGSGDAGGVYDIAWPARVERREGQWLWIKDTSGYSHPTRSGWINTAQALKFAEAAQYYTEQLQTSQRGALYWLRGICWETQGEKDVAMLDYNDAIKYFDLERASNAQSADAHMRLGRIEAAQPATPQPTPAPPEVLKAGTASAMTSAANASQLPPPTASSAAANSTDCDKHATAHSWVARFQRATAGTGDRPRFHHEWAEAHRKAYEQSSADSKAADIDFAAAECHYEKAKRIATGWSPPHYGHAALHLAKGKKARGGILDDDGIPTPVADQTPANSSVAPADVVAADAKDVAAANPKTAGAADQAAGQAKNSQHANAGANKAETKSVSDAGQASLKEAIQKCNEAIRLNPQYTQAYSDRAEAQYALGNYPAARMSAQKACELSQYRQPASLKILARAYAHLQVYNMAAYFAQKAAENASTQEEQSSMCALCNKYVAEYVKSPEAAPINLLSQQVASTDVPRDSKSPTGGHGSSHGKSATSRLPGSNTVAERESAQAREENAPPSNDSSRQRVYFLPTFTPRGLGASGL